MNSRRRSSLRRELSGLLFAAALLTGTIAQAKEAPGRIAILSIKSGPGAPPKVAARATEALAQQVAATHPFATVLRPADVARALGKAKAKKLAACAQPRCLAIIAKATAADSVVFGSLGKAKKSLALSVSVYEGGAVSRRSRQKVASLRDDAFRDAASAAAHELYPPASPPPLTPEPAQPVAEAPAPAPEPAFGPAPAAPSASSAASSSSSPAEPADPRAEAPEVSASVGRSSAPGPFSISARVQIEARSDHLGMAGYLGVGYAFLPSLSAEVGGLLAANAQGAEARLSWAPIAFNSDESLRALIRLEVPVLYNHGTEIVAGQSTEVSRILYGVGASVGVEYAPSRLFAFGLEVPVLYLLNAPEGTAKLFVFAAPFVALRF